VRAASLIADVLGHNRVTWVKLPRATRAHTFEGEVSGSKWVVPECVNVGTTSVPSAPMASSSAATTVAGPPSTWGRGHGP
jgi:hypothetical protein